jgi:phosphate transport system ATP-binding protein
MSAPATAAAPVLVVEGFDGWYGPFHALKGVSLAVPRHAITALIGPSGCGKSTLIRCFNRMNDGIRTWRATGRLLVDGADILAGDADLVALRKRVGMVFQRPNPFPLSVFENVAYGPRIHGLARGADLDRRVQQALADTGLWDEVKDRLRANALSLSAEQQQRLCISRLLAVEPEVLLMDEPCSALDPQATQKIEALMRDLKAKYTIVIVTHNMSQASRVSDQAGFMLLGELVEFGPTAGIFLTPKDKRTQDYVTGRYG